MSGKTRKDIEMENLEKATTLKEKIDLERHNQAMYQERDAQLEAYRIKQSLNEAKRSENLSGKRQKEVESIHKIDEMRKQDRHNTLQQHNVASLIMEMEPRLRALGEAISNLQSRLVQEYITDSASKLAWSDWNYFKPTGMPNLPEDAKVENPKLEYIVKVNDKGGLEANFVTKQIENFLVYRDEKGNTGKDKDGKLVVDRQKCALFQSCFQEGVEKGLAAKDYVVLKENDIFRVYPKHYCQQHQNGSWVLNTKKVEEHYDLNDCHYDRVMNSYTPKPNARSRTGVPMYLETAAFERLTNDLNDFLKTHFDGVINKFEDDNVPDNQTTMRM